MPQGIGQVKRSASGRATSGGRKRYTHKDPAQDADIASLLDRRIDRELFGRHLERLPATVRLGGIAQLVERVLCKHEVTGSNPVASTNWHQCLRRRGTESGV